MGQNNNINYTIGFKADTTELISALQKAQRMLEQINITPKFQLSEQLQKSSQSALELSNHLQKAFNQETGKLDLVNFNNSLKQSGKTLKDYANDLSNIGPDGERAFLQVASAISKAELPLKRTNKLLDDLWVTMKNTARWQLTSSAMHGFTSALNTAYGYSKDLNRSLNSIQIVTNKSTEDMANFAKTANDAAKSLSTVTTDYTDASLIYYQQGLDDQAVQERTDTTIKLANVSRQSAQQASEQLTAIWNNFDDGSKSLEYYADVITALGAATASSSQEISTGLQKFSAVADSVGLSYEYATAALATITATTRESADIVGTSLRTLFARIQGLMQDETQDDGTTLNKYSKALATVGIDIKTAEGEMKDMNVILDEMGAKWEQLSKSQQLALAQTVAGVRQYSQLIALMDNWDFFKENVGVATASTGSLQEQADIYAESWEAARNRVRAASQEIYQALINPQAFIDMDDVLTPFLSGIATVVESVGGLKGVLQIVADLGLQIYGPKIAQSLRDVGTNILILTKYESKRSRELQNQAVTLAENLKMSMSANEADAIKLNLLRKEISLQGEINEHYDQLNDYQKQYIANEQKGIELLKQKSLQIADNIQAAADEKQEYATTLYSTELDKKNPLATDGKWIQQFTSLVNNSNQYPTIKLNVKADPASFQKSLTSLIMELDRIGSRKAQLDQLTQSFNKLEVAGGATENDLRKLLTVFDQTPEANASLQQMKDRVYELQKEALDCGTAVEHMNIRLQNLEADPEAIRNFNREIKNMQLAVDQEAMVQEAMNKLMDDMHKHMHGEGIPTMHDWADSIVAATQTLNQGMMILQSIQSLGNILSDKDASTSEKLLAIGSSLSLVLPALASAFKALNTQKILSNGITVQTISLGITEFFQKREITKAVATGTKVTEKDTMATIANTAAKTANRAVVGIAIIALTALAAAIYLASNAQDKYTKALKDAEEQQEKANEAYEKASQSYEDLKNKIENYQKTVEAFRAMETGAEGYADKLAEVNEQARQLLETNLQLQGSAYRAEDGSIQFYGSSLDDALKQQQERRETLAAMKSLAAANTNRQTLAKTYNEEREKFRGTAYQVGYSTSDFTWIGSQVNDEQFADLIDTIKIQGSIGEQQVRDIVGENDRLVNAILDNLQVLEDLAAEMREVDRANAFLEQDVIWRNYAQLNPNQQYTQTQQNFVSSVLGSIVNQDDLNEAIKQIKESASFQEGDEPLLEYSRLMGGDNFRRDRDNNITVTLKGQAISDPQHVNEILDQIAIQRAYTQFVTDNQQSLEASMTTLKQLDNELDMEVSNILMQLGGSEGRLIDYENLTPEIVEQLSSIDFYKLLTDAKVDEATATVIAQGIDAGFDHEYDLSIYYQTQIDNARKAAQSIGDILLAYQNNDELNEQQLAYLEKLEGQYYQLNDVREKGGHEYLQLLRAIQEQEEKNAQDNLDILYRQQQEELYNLRLQLGETLNKRNQERERWQVPDFIKLDIDYEVEELQKQIQEKLDQISDTRYQIQVAVDADLESDIAQGFGLANEIQDIQNLLSNGLEITFDEAQALIAKGYGDILLGAQETANATILIQEESAKNFFETKKAEVEISREAKIKQLEDELALVRAKRESLQAVKKELIAAQEADRVENKATHLAKAASLFQYVKNLKTTKENELDVIDKANDKQNELAEELADSLLGIQKEQTENLQTGIAKGEQAAITASNTQIEAIDKIGVALNELSQAYKNAPDGKADYQPHGSSGVTAKVTVDTSGMSDSIKGAYQLGKSNLIEFNEEKVKNAILEATQEMLEQIDIEDQAFLAQEGSIEGAIAALKSSSLSLDDFMTNWGKKSGSGGSSGKSKSEKDADKKDLKDIEERYHEINREIERQNDLLDDVSNNLDRTYGASKFRNFSKQLQELTKQQANYNSKLEDANKYLETDKAELQRLFDNVTIKSNGELANYENLLDQTIVNYNKFIDQYNEFLILYNAMTKEQQESNQALFDDWTEKKEQAQKDYDSRLAALKQYEDTRDTIQEINDELEEIGRNIADNKLQQLEYKLEIVLDVKSMRDAIREFNIKVNESFNDALTHGVAVGDLSKEQAQAEADLYPQYKQQYEDLVALYESADQYMDRDQIISDIKDLQGNVLQSAEAILEWVNSIEDIIPNAFDAARERYNLFTNQLKHNNTVLDTIKELYTLQGVTYKTMEGFNRLQKVSQERLDAQLAEAALQRRWYDEARVKLEQAQADLDSLGGDETDIRYDTYKKARDAFLQEFNEAEEAYLSLAKDAMTTAQDMYVDQLERAAYEFGQVISNGLGLDLLQDKYDHYIETNERYFDKVTEAYQVSSWFNKLQDDIDKTTNAQTKERLKALQEEINIRRENNQLSQYDLDILNAKYEVLQAQMALEDAQSAKNELKLVRDSQGNWNYQYVADQEQIANAEQDLLDANNNWYEIAKKQVTDVTGQIIGTWQECQDKIKEIYSDMSLTDEERSAKAQEIYNYYTEKIKFLEQEKQNAIKDMTEAGNAALITNAVITGDTISDLTGITAEDIKNIVETNGIEIKDLLTKDSEELKDIVANNTELIDLFDNVYAKDLENMTVNTDNFENALQDILSRAQDDFDNFKNTIQDVANDAGVSLDELDEKTNKVSESTDTLRESGLDAADAIWEMIDATTDAVDGYLDLADSIWETIEALRELASAQADYVDSKSHGDYDYDIDDYEEETPKYEHYEFTVPTGGGGKYNTAPGGSNSLENMSIEDQKGIAYAIWNGGAGWGNGQDRKKNIENKFGSGSYQTYQDIVNKYDISKKAANGSWTSDIGIYSYDELRKKYGINAFETGGYTGSFADAKLAFLHEKELVLNQRDTENILQAVSIVRDLFANIERQLDSDALSAIALMGQRLFVPTVNTPSGELQQNVHVDQIVFPNPISASEIEEALVSFVNDTSQWVNRKR